MIMRMFFYPPPRDNNTINRSPKPVSFVGVELILVFIE